MITRECVGELKETIGISAKRLRHTENCSVGLPTILIKGML